MSILFSIKANLYADFSAPLASSGWHHCSVLRMLSKHLSLRDLPTASADLPRWQKLEGVQEPGACKVRAWGGAEI